MLSDLFIISTTNFTDSAGSIGSTVQPQPPMLCELCPALEVCAVGLISSLLSIAEFHGSEVNVTNDTMVWAVQFIGCSLKATDEQMTVDAQTKLPTSQATLETDSSTWSAWNRSTTDTNSGAFYDDVRTL